MIWEEITVALIAVCAVALICAAIALVLMYRYKAESEQLHMKNSGLILAKGDAELEAMLRATERDTLKKHNLILTDRIQGIEAERDALRAQLEAARADVEHLGILASSAPEEIKQVRRASRKKPAESEAV